MIPARTSFLRHVPGSTRNARRPSGAVHRCRPGHAAYDPAYVCPRRIRSPRRPGGCARSASPAPRLTATGHAPRPPAPRCTRSQVPSALQQRNHRYATSRGTRSCGTCRQAVPVRGTYRIVSMTDRRGGRNGRPPRRGSRLGNNGSITAHCPSVSDDSYAGLQTQRHTQGDDFAGALAEAVERRGGGSISFWRSLPGACDSGAPPARPEPITGSLSGALMKPQRRKRAAPRTDPVRSPS